MIMQDDYAKKKFLVANFALTPTDIQGAAPAADRNIFCKFSSNQTEQTPFSFT